MQGVTVDEDRVNSIKMLADKLITQGRTDTKFIQDKRDSLVDKYGLFSAKTVSFMSKLARVGVRDTISSKIRDSLVNKYELFAARLCQNLCLLLGLHRI